MIPLLLSLIASPALALDRPAPIPDPLEPRNLTLPDPEIGTLSNGMQIRVAPNTEVPLWEVRLVLGVGSYADPVGKEGLTSLVFDMLDEGAGDRDASAMSAEMKRLAGSVGASSGAVSATISASGIKDTMPEVLAMWADVVRNPTFPEDAWTTVHSKHVSDERLALKNPNTMMRNVWRSLFWGDSYIGRHSTVETVEAVTLDDVKAFHGTYVHPENAILLVGGDITLAEIQPMLEELLDGWSVQGAETAPVVAEAIAIEGEKIYFVDNPGAAQSIIQSATVLGTLEQEDHFDLMVGNEMYGGDFTGRVNMNLREDKGYTYGAGCWISHRHGPGSYGCSARVRTDATAASLIEFRKEMGDVTGDRPLTDEEVSRSKDSMVYGYPSQFETTGPMLDLEFEIWRYGKNEDWAAEYIPNIRAVTTESARAAMSKWLVPERTHWVIVGDKAQVWSDLEAIGLPIVELDVHGKPVAAE